MNRYFYYLILVTFIVNVLGAVPNTLFEAKTSGGIISMLLAIAIGTFFIYLLTVFFNRFPGLGFPELLKNHMPKWISFFLLFCFGLLWFADRGRGINFNCFFNEKIFNPRYAHYLDYSASFSFCLFWSIAINEKCFIYSRDYFTTKLAINRSCHFTIIP